MSPTDQLVLLIEDEPGIRRFIRVTLASNGFRVNEVACAADGLKRAASDRPDLIVLDLGLPDRDGMEVLTEIREWSSVPIVVLTARDSERSKVDALDAGADDYLTKPFGAEELLARIRVALRHALRASAPQDPVFTTGELRVDLAARVITVAGREVHLTPIEFRLLATLVKHAGKVLTHRQLLNAGWGPEYGFESHYLRVYMAQLRRKLEADSANPRYLRTEPGVGYRLVLEG
jgi:two-component system, OmpR family, KDP operon response regulator KdpE